MRQYFKSTGFYFIGLVCAMWLSCAVIDQATAASPIPFNEFEVGDTGSPATLGKNPGDITTVCPATVSNPGVIVEFVCSNETVDNGMLQRDIMITVNNLGSGMITKNSYIQSILTEPGVTGEGTANPFSLARGSVNFVNEDFIRINNRGDGISSRQTTIESKFLDSGNLEDRLVLTQEFNNGWAGPGESSLLSTQQSIERLDYSLDINNPTLIFSDSFDILADKGDLLVNTLIDALQKVDLSDGAGNSDIQDFQFSRIGGNYNQDSGKLWDSGTDGVFLEDGGFDTFGWGTFESVEALWIGQSIAANHKYGLERYTNYDYEIAPSVTVEKTVRKHSFDNAEATAWDKTQRFGTRETLSAGMGPTLAPTNLAVFYPVYAVTADPFSGIVGTGTSGTGIDPLLADSVPLPWAYDNWSVINGVFYDLSGTSAVPCPLFADNCSDPVVNSEGLYQRIIQVAGIQYVQTIITDKNASGNPGAATFNGVGAGRTIAADALTFRSESIVRLDDAVQGIAANQYIAELDLSHLSTTNLSSTAGEFEYNTTLSTGWAHIDNARDARLTVDQRVAVFDNQSSASTSTENIFSMKVGDAAIDREIDIFSVAATDGFLSQTFEYPIMFASSIRSGQFQHTNRTADDLNPLLDSSTDPDIGWLAGESIQSTWVGGAYITIVPGDISTISANSYTNLTTGARTSVAITDGNVQNPLPDAENWLVDPFGPVPAYLDPYPSVITTP